VVELTRGEVVLITLPGDYGKRRSAVVVQSDRFAPDFASVLVCPLTSDPLEHSVARIALAPTPQNGLPSAGSLMVDKVAAVPLARVFRSIGRLDDATLQRLDASLSLMLGVA
jgi:mRNA interferase MazF